MKKQIISLVVIILVIAAIIFCFFLKEKEPEEGIRPGAEEDFYAYLELPSFNGKFLEFREAESKMSILCLDTATMKISQRTFKVDQETIFSKITSDPRQPDLFPKEDLEKIEQETQTTVFYLVAEKENEIPLARLIQAEVAF